MDSTPKTDNAALRPEDKSVCASLSGLEVRIPDFQKMLPFGQFVGVFLLVAANDDLTGLLYIKIKIFHLFNEEVRN